MSRAGNTIRAQRKLLLDYASALSGSAGRLIFSLVYFVALANTLSIADFGVFATASATGVVLSRILAFGFISPLYRISTVKPLLVGTYLGGFVLMGLLSLPLLTLAALGAHAFFFAGVMPLGLFLLVVASEAIFWRGTEVVVIINNGMNRFGQGAVLVVFGTFLRGLAALAFAVTSTADLASWCWYYLAANVVALAVAIIFFYPGGRLRIAPKLYWRRMRDSLSVAGADILFYLQMELDKLLVLSLGGPVLAGIYAIVMRLVDLTAVPIRAFSMILVQRIMRSPDLLTRFRVKASIEAGIFVISTAALGTLALLLTLQPALLGRQVAEAAPFVALALLIPGLRNLVEYQAELLYARGQTLLRAINLALLGGLKAMLLAHALLLMTDTPELIFNLNAVFALIYLASALLTYTALRLPARPV